MSGILKKKKLLFGLLMVVLIDVVLSIKIPEFVSIVIALNIAVIATFFVNSKALRIIYSQKVPFGYKSKIRNIDALIIGDMCNPKLVLPDSCKTYVQIKAPGRTLWSSFEVLKHTSSIIKETGGTVIFVCQLDNMDKKIYSVFDIPFFVRITLKKYGIGYMKLLAKFPLIVKPFSTIRLLLDKNKKEYVKKTCSDNEIVTFCHERGYELHLYVS